MYHGADDSVQNDCSDLVEERSRRHEVASVDDDRRQKNEEESSTVELVVVDVSGVCQVQHHTNSDSHDDQHTALGHQLKSLLVSVVHCNVIECSAMSTLQHATHEWPILFLVYCILYSFSCFCI